jgi:hypothetical protein
VLGLDLVEQCRDVRFLDVGEHEAAERWQQMLPDPTFLLSDLALAPADPCEPVLGDNGLRWCVFQANTLNYSFAAEQARELHQYVSSKCDDDYCRARRGDRLSRKGCNHPVVNSTGPSRHFGFHSRASLCASAICAGVILAATTFLSLGASFSPAAADKLNHMCAVT